MKIWLLILHTIIYYFSSLHFSPFFSSLFCSPPFFFPCFFHSLNQSYLHVQQHNEHLLHTANMHQQQPNNPKQQQQQRTYPLPPKLNRPASVLLEPSTVYHAQEIVTRPRSQSQAVYST